MFLLKLATLTSCLRLALIDSLYFSMHLSISPLPSILNASAVDSSPGGLSNLGG